MTSSLDVEALGHVRDLYMDAREAYPDTPDDAVDPWEYHYPSEAYAEEEAEFARLNP